MASNPTAFRHCRNIAQQHYENFPVASLLLPAKIRTAVMVIYAFARTADDIADEGDHEPDQRLQWLHSYRRQLHQTQSPATAHDADFIFTALHQIIHQYHLPVSLFDKLLDAFEQDISHRGYEHEQALLDYCSASANPVGRLMLCLHNKRSELNFTLSDHLCTALQLINFIQDLQQDVAELKRLYIPICDLESVGISRAHLIRQIKNGAAYSHTDKLLINRQIKRAENLLLSGKPLVKQLNGRFKWEIKVIIQAAEMMLQKLKLTTAYGQRPRLNRKDKLQLFFALFNR